MIIAAVCKLKKTKDGWLVPSQTGTERIYTVNLKAQTCTCPDHAGSGHKCKHIYAAEITYKRELSADGTVTETKSVTLTEKKTYLQDWEGATEEEQSPLALNPLPNLNLHLNLSLLGPLLAMESYTAPSFRSRPSIAQTASNPVCLSIVALRLDPP